MMASSGRREGDRDMSRVFRSSILPNKDLISIDRTFYTTWRQFLESGECRTVDPGKNTLSLKLNKGDGDATFTSGVTKLAEFYNLKYTHNVEFYYRGGDVFDIRIFTVNGAEIPYPVVIDSDSESVDDSEKIPWIMKVTKAVVPGKNPLPIPAWVARDVLMDDQDVLYLTDKLGQRIEAKLLWANRGRAECTVGLGWYNYCRALRLRVGDILKFVIEDGGYELFVDVIRKDD